MKLLAEAWRGAKGWRALLTGHGDWRAFFDLSFGGLLGALLFYLLVVAINLMVQLSGAEMVALSALLTNVIANLLPAAGLIIAVLVSQAFLRLKGSLFALLVPGLYALSLALLVGLPLSLIGIPVGPVLLLVLGYLLFRLASAAAGLGLRLSIACAALCIVLLVALPLSLYMVIAPGPGPT